MSFFVKINFLAIVISGVLALGACQLQQPHYVRTELLFALERPSGQPVTQQEWQNFIDNHITPYFPAGLSIVDIYGQWRRKSGRLQKLESKALIIFHVPTPENEQAIEAIRTLYKQQFSQESVLRATNPVTVSF